MNISKINPLAIGAIFLTLVATYQNFSQIGSHSWWIALCCGCALGCVTRASYESRKYFVIAALLILVAGLTKSKDLAAENRSFVTGIAQGMLITILLWRGILRIGKGKG